MFRLVKTTIIKIRTSKVHEEGNHIPIAIRQRILLITCSMQQCPLEKVTGSHLVKKFPASYGTRRFITAFTSAHYLYLSWANSIQSKPPHPTSWRYILILSSHLRLGLREYSYGPDLVLTQNIVKYHLWETFLYTLKPFFVYKTPINDNCLTLYLFRSLRYPFTVSFTPWRRMCHEPRHFIISYQYRGRY